MPTWRLIKDGGDEAKPTLFGRLIQVIQDGEAVLIGRSMLGPKTCFSSKVPRDMERQQSSTFASYEKLGSVTEILLQPNP